MPGRRLKIYSLFLLLVVFFAAETAMAAVIDVVKVEGNRRIPVETILADAVKPGDDFDMVNINASVKKILEKGKLLDVKVDMNLDDDKLTLTYLIKEKPYINKVYIEGNAEISEENLLGEIEGLAGDLLDSEKLEYNVQKLQYYYQDNAYYSVEIKTDVEERGNNTVDVVFSIVEGPEAKVSEIKFLGNKFFESDDLEDEMKTETKGFFTWFTGSGKLVEGELKNDILKLHSLYKNNGFARAQISEPEIILSEDKEDLTLVIRITEGTRYRMGKIEFDGNKSKSNADLESVLKTKTGEYFNATTFTQDIDRLTDQFTQVGYAFANVEPVNSYDDERGVIDVNYKIEENVLVKINRINIRGNSSTRDRVIRRELDVNEGDVYNSKDLRQSRQNLQFTDYFEKVLISEDRMGDDLIDLNIDVADKRTGMFMAGMGYSTVEEFSLMFKVSQKNLFGLGYKLNATAEFSDLRTDYAVYFTNPWLFDKPYSFTVGVFKTKRSYYEYTKRNVGFSLRLGHELIKRKLSASYKYLYENVEIEDIDVDASDYIWDQEGKTATRSFIPSLTWDTRNHPYDPTAGNYANVYFKYAGGALGGDNDFYKTVTEYIHYFPVGDEDAIALRIEGGYARAMSGNDLPVSERFRLGGLNTLRGFSFGKISPLDEDGERFGGDKYFLGNLEYILPLSNEDHLKLAIFTDFGQVYKEGEQYLSGDLKKSAGIEFRWYSPIGPLRLIYGRVIDPEEGESSSRWDFSIGGMF